MNNVNAVSVPDCQQYVVTGRALRPEAAPFVSADGQLDAVAEKGTPPSLGAVSSVADRPPVMEVYHPSVDNVVQGMVNSRGGAVGDYQLSSSRHGERRQSRGRQQSRYKGHRGCLLYTSPSPRDRTRSRMPSSA